MLHHLSTDDFGAGWLSLMRWTSRMTWRLKQRIRRLDLPLSQCLPLHAFCAMTSVGPNLLYVRVIPS